MGAPPDRQRQFRFSYGVRTDKIQTATLEKVDGATIEIEPTTKSGSIEGGNWSISPAGKQTVTTSGHTADDNYQKNGGDASASWSLHYAVTKTSGTRNGQVGPFTTQELLMRPPTVPATPPLRNCRVRPRTLSTML